MHFTWNFNTFALKNAINPILRTRFCQEIFLKILYALVGVIGCTHILSTKTFTQITAIFYEKKTIQNRGQM